MLNGITGVNGTFLNFWCILRLHVVVLNQIISQSQVKWPCSAINTSLYIYYNILTLFHYSVFSQVDMINFIHLEEKINDGWIPFRYLSFKVLISCMLAHYDESFLLVIKNHQYHKKKTCVETQKHTKNFQT